MSQKTTSLIAIAVAVIALIVSGVNLLQAPAQVETLGVTNFDAITLTGALTADDVTATDDVTGGDVIATGNVTGTALFINNIKQSGAVKFGVSVDATDSTSIAHGFATTPTVVLVSGSAGITATVGTITTTRFSVRTPGTVTIYWLAGP